MVRLRSATVGARTVPALDSVTPQIGPSFSRITEQSSKLNAIIERQYIPDARRSPQHLDSFLDSFKGNTPISPATPTSPHYPSLEQVLEKSINTRIAAALLKTPIMSKSKVPSAATTGKKIGTFSTKSKNDPMTPVKAGFNVPEGKGAFGFRAGLAMQGRKILNGLTGKKTPATPAPATPMAVETPTTPSVENEEMKDWSESDSEIPRGSQTEPRPKRKRFSDIHRQQFAKMDSIANHYAAKRTTPSVTPNAPKSAVPEVTPKNAPLTPEMAPKGIKRLKSQAVLGDREPPTSPSPVKRRTDTDADGSREEERSPVKRQKLDSTVPLERKSKIARFAAGSSTPMKRPMPRNMAAPATVAALNRNMALKAPSSKRTMPALPKPSAFNLTPSTTLSTPVTAPTPSKIPATPGRAPSLRPRNAPATIGASKLNTMINFAEATPARGTTERAPPTTVGGFTFRSRRGPSGLGFGALKEIHDKKAGMEMLKFESKLGTPKVSENDPVGVEDPFAERDVGTPVARGKKRKNEVEHSIDDRDIGKDVDEKMEGIIMEEEAPEEEPEKMEHSEKEEEAPEEKKQPGPAPTPARKRLRFDTPNGKEAATPAKEQTLAEAVAKANDRRRRLNFLATPKKRAAGEGDRLGSKSLWK